MKTEKKYSSKVVCLFRSLKPFAFLDASSSEEDIEELSTEAEDSVLIGDLKGSFAFDGNSRIESELHSTF